MLWDRLTELNSKSKFYNVDSFRDGHCSLRPIEVQEVGDVTGKRLLHLQCHFGMDTLSWARRGAIATGVDFSPAAIKMARKLNAELSMDVRFVEAHIADIPNTLKETFDIVFASYGVLCWLPDLTKWAQTIARSLVPDGVFHLVEGHPINHVFENDSSATDLQVSYSYFHDDEPMRWDDDEPYADRSEKTGMPSFEWTHSMSDILNSLIQSGLTIEYLNEFPYCVYDHYPFLEKCPDGWYRFKDGKETIPMTFSLKARKNPNKTNAADAENCAADL